METREERASYQIEVKFLLDEVVYLVQDQKIQKKIIRNALIVPDDILYMFKGEGDIYKIPEHRLFRTPKDAANDYARFLLDDWLTRVKK